MQSRWIAPALVILFAFVAPGQSPTPKKPDREFFFQNATTPAAHSDLLTAIRTVADVSQLSLNEESKSMSVSGAADRVAAADWLFHELDRTAAPQTPAIHEYVTPGAPDDVTKVVYFAHINSQLELTDMVTLIRTVADVPRMFPISSLQAIVMRGTAAKIGIADWLIQQLDITATPSPGVREYRTQDERNGPTLVHVWFPSYATTAEALTYTVTALRTIADVNRLFPYQSLHAIVGRSDPDRIALGDWLVHELEQPPAPGTTPAPGAHEFRLPGTSEVAKVFRMPANATQQQLIGMVNDMRSTAGVNRLFPFSGINMIAARGTGSQMNDAERLLQERKP